MKFKWVWVLPLGFIGIVTFAGSVQATPGSGYTSTTLAKGQFEEIAAYVHTPPHWQAKIKTKGRSDLYVQSNVWAPGGTTGWHTHPGPSLIIVTAGTVTAYDGDDPTCTPHVYSQGMGFVDPGGTHVHVLRNEGNVEASTIAVQLVPTGAIRRIDAPDPGNCPF
jgi:quercetin dioxygenase-like cupin family protein